MLVCESASRDTALPLLAKNPRVANSSKDGCGKGSAIDADRMPAATEATRGAALRRRHSAMAGLRRIDKRRVRMATHERMAAGGDCLLRGWKDVPGIRETALVARLEVEGRPARIGRRPDPSDRAA